MKTQKAIKKFTILIFFSKKWRCKLLKCINCLNCGNCFHPGLDLPSLPALLHYYSIHSFQIIRISFLKKCSPVWFCRQGMFPPRQFAFPQSNGTGESRGATFCRTAPLSPTWSYIYRTPYFCYSTHVPKKSGCQKGPFYKDINCDSCREMGLRRTMDSLTFKLFSYFDLVDTELFSGTMNSSFLVIIHPRSEKDWSYFLTLLCQCFLIDIWIPVCAAL